MIKFGGWSISFESLDLAKGTLKAHILGKVGSQTVNIHVEIKPKTDTKVADFSINVEAWEDD